MAYVVARPHGRFEIRESLHTAKGPRARTLAGFGVLTDEVLSKAGRRAQRPFDTTAVVASAQRAGATGPAIGLESSRVASSREAVVREPPATDTDAAAEPFWPASRFLRASRRMAQTVKPSTVVRRSDPGTALIELLGFADAVARSQAPRALEPLAFPVLARLAAGRQTQPPPSG